MLILTLLDDHLAICRLDVTAGVPAWATAASLFSVTRTADELSIVCLEECVPDGVRCEKGWRAFELEGPFEFSEVGIISAVATPLAEAGSASLPSPPLTPITFSSKRKGRTSPLMCCAQRNTRSVAFRRWKGERGVRVRFVRHAPFVFESCDGAGAGRPDARTRGCRRAGDDDAQPAAPPADESAIRQGGDGRAACGDPWGARQSRPRRPLGLEGREPHSRTPPIRHQPLPGHPRRARRRVGSWGLMEWVEITADGETLKVP